MEISKIQETLLAVMPQWHYWLARPFKQLLREGISLEMYYCIQMLRLNNDAMTISELAARTGMTKQQMSKLANRLIEHGFAERESDPDDRRLVKIRVTKDALEYIDRFLETDAGYYKTFFNSMEPSERDEFGNALETIQRILDKADVHDIGKRSAVGLCRSKGKHKRKGDDRI